MKPTGDNLRDLMRTMYPDVDDGSEHPITAIGSVLLAAALFGITDEEALVRLTAYPKNFIAAILFNLRGNRVLNNGSYDSSEWLSSDGAIDDQGFWSMSKRHAAIFGLVLMISSHSIAARSTGKTLRATGLTHVPVVIQEVNQTDLIKPQYKKALRAGIPNAYLPVKDESSAASL